MIFNISTHNRDDHSKNFAFAWHQDTRHQGQWRLTPAYDLIFSNGIHGEHTMAGAGESKSPFLNEVLQLAKKTGLEKETQDIIAQVNQIVSNWKLYAEQASISSKSMKVISNHLITL